MVREDWAQHGTAMAASSARIRDWLGSRPDLFAVTNLEKFNARELSADVEAVRLLLSDAEECEVVSFAELTDIVRQNKNADVAIVVLHPYEQRDLELIRTFVSSGRADRVFVMIWSPEDAVRTWLDATGALDLHTGVSAPTADPLLVAAVKLMIAEEYNGLSSGRGKDAVVQLLRSFARAGYPLDEEIWLRTYFASGGGFRHAKSISKLIHEMKSGVRHRTKPRYRDEIVDILRERVASEQV